MGMTCIALAAITLVSPRSGEVMSTITDEQIKVFAGSNTVQRAQILKEVNKKPNRLAWRRQRPLVMRWRTTEHEKGPWRIRIGTKDDLSDAKDIWLDAETAKRVKAKDGKSSTWTYSIANPNLELGRTYYWQVWSRVKCSKHSCGFTYPDKCKCGRTKHGNISPVSSFSTDDTPPRWIRLEGRVSNFRDLGGWKTSDGGRVRLGLVYRGQGLNDNSVAGFEPGRNRLMVEDVLYMKKVLGIKTDLDLRSPREVAGMTESPLGEGVQFVNRSSSAYRHIVEKEAKKTMAENFRLFCDRANYPVYFHCIAGADRTGSLAYVLNGLLGVAKEDLERDWESTFYPGTYADKPLGSRSCSHFDRAFAKYGKKGDSLQKRIELYLLDCGVTPEEIEKFKGIMLERDVK